MVKIDPYGPLRTIAGYANPAGGFSGDGEPARSAELNCPAGLAFDRGGNLYVADLNNNRIRRIDRNGIISTVAGSGPANGAPGGFAGDGGLATSALLRSPTDIAFDASGNLYLADANNYRIRKVDKQGVITTVAGTGTSGFSGDGGPATAAQLSTATISGPGNSGIAIDAAGNLYVADGGNGRVRKIDKQGMITTIAGSGGEHIAGDGGLATAAVLSRPNGLAFDANGNLYIATGDSSFIFDDRVRKIDQHGIITTVVGAGAPDFSGDGGPAISANLNQPWGIAFDTQGNLYIADEDNSRVRKVDKYGIITTVVGGRP